MSDEFRIVRTQCDLELVRQLRREAFEVELGYDYAGLDESVDEYSTVMLWTRGDRAIGSVRVTVRADGPLEDESVLDLERWKAAGGFTDAEICQVSRLVVAPDLRGRGLVTRMTAGLYTLMQHRNVALVFIDTSTQLLAYYLRFGFRRFRPSYTHPILGMELHPLVLFMGDAEHFERVGSRLRVLECADTAKRARAVYQRHFSHGVSAP